MKKIAGNLFLLNEEHCLMMVDAFGAVTWWGFSPALDLQDKGELFLTCVSSLACCGILDVTTYM